MTKKQIGQILEHYRNTLKEMGIPKKEFPHGKFSRSRRERLAHAHAMLDEMEVFLKEKGTKKREKLMRWIGYVQAYLEASKVFTIEHMKNHNRP